MELLTQGAPFGKMKPDPMLIYFLPALLLLPGCGLLIGSQKPYDLKDERYSILDLSKDDSRWQVLESDPSEVHSNDRADRAYQAKDSYAIISVNSACRNSRPAPEAGYSETELTRITAQMLRGMNEIHSRSEVPTKMLGLPGLRTKASGTVDGEPTVIEILLLPLEECLYDFLLVSRPEHHVKEAAVFQKFLDSFRASRKP
jgi:hypothetical protein